MSQYPYLGEVQMFSFNFAPTNWAFCNGQITAISQNQALFSLLGTMYGGNGQTTFGLPNIQGRVAMHVGNGHMLGEIGGEATHILAPNELAAHTHLASADAQPTNATSFNPSNAYSANAAPVLEYSAGSSNMVAMSPQMVTTVGGGQSHENRQPFLTLNFCIALSGVYPSHS